MAERNETKEATFYKNHPIWAAIIAGLIVALLSTFLIKCIWPTEVEKNNASQVETIEYDMTIESNENDIGPFEENNLSYIKCLLITALLYSVLYFPTYGILKHFCEGESAIYITFIMTFGLFFVLLFYFGTEIRDVAYKLYYLFC